MRPALIVLAALVLLAVLWLAWRSARTPAPRSLGVADGRLADCPRTPNCVASQATRESRRVEPVPLDALGDDPLGAVERVLAGWPRTRVVERADGYLRAECRSLLFRFVDDLEVLVDREAGVLHVRSASRTGRSDLGVNRRRVEQLRERLGA